MQTHVGDREDCHTAGDRLGIPEAASYRSVAPNFVAQVSMIDFAAASTGTQLPH